MNEEKDNRIKQYAMIGGLVVATGIVLGCMNDNKRQQRIEDEIRDNDNRRLRALRRQEFFHNLIYKLFKIEL